MIYAKEVGDFKTTLSIISKDKIFKYSIYGNYNLFIFI